MFRGFFGEDAEEMAATPVAELRSYYQVRIDERTENPGDVTPRPTSSPT